MKVMAFEEAKKWCSQVGLRLARDGDLRYPRSPEHRFFVLAPEEFRQIMVFTYAMLVFRSESNFCGGLLWLRRWTIGSPQMVRVGWRIIEDIRRVHGGPQSLEVAPAQLFRDDEFVDLHAFLAQVVGFGWIADFVPSTGNFFLHFKDNRQVCFTAESVDLLNELRSEFSHWNPTEDDPMVRKLAELERGGARRRVAHQ